MNDRIARIAHRIVADYGDTQAYFNIFDFFDLKDADELAIRTATEVLSNAISAESSKFDRLIRARLRRRAKELEGMGITLK